MTSMRVFHGLRFWRSWALGMSFCGGRRRAHARPVVAVIDTRSTTAKDVVISFAAGADREMGLRF
jgi:hypothetical protein